MPDRIYKHIMKIVEDVKKRESELEKKVEAQSEENKRLHKAIDNMIVTSMKHYNHKCDNHIEGFRLNYCKKEPRENSRHTFIPSCKYQWQHYGRTICMIKYDNKKTKKKE